MIQTVCVAGAGTMGSGIAQVAAAAGHPTILFDLNEAVLAKAAAGIRKNLDWLIGKQKLTADQAQDVFSRIVFTSKPETCQADLVIEAIIEKLEAKLHLFQQLHQINTSHCIFATNTSSLSVNQLQAALPHPERVAGLHFFNPAPLMKLVEVVAGDQTDPAIVDQLTGLCRGWGKVPVVCKDAPGFIVNRVARHYYLEAMKQVELGLASAATIDAAMEAAGFKMGPFKLMDLIGMDINYAVSQSVYEAFGKELRFTPSPVQAAKVASGELGRKTGKGFYEYPSN